MTLRNAINFDLPNHAAAKVKRALDDVFQLTNDPEEMLRIAIMASGICIGAGSGFLAGKMRSEGKKVTDTEMILAVIDMLRARFGDGEIQKVPK